MEINIGISECEKNVDNYYGRNIGSHTAPAERLFTVSSPFMVNNTVLLTDRNCKKTSILILSKHFRLNVNDRKTLKKMTY